MAWNGAGNFQRTNGSFSGAAVWEDDANAGFDIVDSRHDSHDQDLAQGINNCLTKDGQNFPTADLSMNTFKHTNVGDGSARNQYATVGQLQDEGVRAVGSVGGTANAITGSMSPNISAYVTGAQYTFKAIATNSGATTLKIDSAPAVAIQRNVAALVGGEIVSGRYYTVVYDGSVFQLLNTTANPLFLDSVNNRVGIGTTAPASTTHIVGQVNNTIGTGTDQTQLFLSDSDLQTSGLLVGYNYQSGVTEYGRIQARSAGGGTNLVLQGGGGQVLIERTAATDSREKLAIGAGTGSRWLSIDGGNSGAADGSAILLRANGVTTLAIGNASSIQGGTYTAQPLFFNNTGFTFKVVGLGSGAGTNTMKIDTGTGNWTYDVSSMRYKHDIRESVYGLNAVLALQSKQFKYNDTNREDVGFIAEEVYQVVPELVVLNQDNEPDAVSYDRLTSVLCKAIQELNAKVESLEARVAALEA